MEFHLFNQSPNDGNLYGFLFGANAIMSFLFGWIFQVYLGGSIAKWDDWVKVFMILNLDRYNKSALSIKPQPVITHASHLSVVPEINKLLNFCQSFVKLLHKK